MAKTKESESESTISMILGALVVVVVGILVYNYFTNLNKPEDKKNDVVVEKDTEGKQTEGEKIIPQPKGKFPREYQVKAGDDLWKIAEENYGSGYNWVDIASHNKLENPNYLEEGQKLELPKAKVIVAGDLNGEGAQDVAKIEAKEYTVIEGDYLWDIAVRACGDGYTWSQIAQANNLENPDLIHKGNKLKIVCK